MKDNFVLSGRWVLIACLVALLTLMLVLGLGRRRETSLYRFRVRLWSTLLALTAGTGLLAWTGGCSLHRGAPDGEPAAEAGEEAEAASIVVEAEAAEPVPDTAAADEEEKAASDAQTAGDGPIDAATEPGPVAKPPKKKPPVKRCYAAPIADKGY